MSRKVVLVAVVGMAVLLAGGAAAAQVVRVLQGHTDWVRAVAFSPDGQSLASASDDGTVILWNVGTGQQIRVFRGHTDYVLAVAFSPDGRFLVSGSDDETAQVWDVSSGQHVRTFSGHTSSVNAVAVSPDGRYVASGGNDNVVRLWELGSGREVRVLRGHTDWVRGVAISRSGQLVVSGSDDGTVRLWELGSGREVRVLRGHTDWVRGVAISPNGQLVASGADDETVRVWDMATGQVLHVLTGHIDWVRSVAFSPDSRLVASGADDGVVRLWDATTGESMGLFRGHTDWVRSVAFSPDGSLIASGADDATVRLWDAAASMADAPDRECDYVLLRNVTVTPAMVTAGGEITVSFEYMGTGPYYPYEFRWVTTSAGGPSIACHSGDAEACQWHPDTFTLTAPSVAGTHTWYVASYGSQNSVGDCGVEPDDYSEFTFVVTDSASPPPPTGPTTWMEVQADSVCLTVPSEFFDRTEEARREFAEPGVEWIGAWSGYHEGGDLDADPNALVAVVRLAAAELDSARNRGERDSYYTELRQWNEDVLGQPGTWHTGDSFGERSWFAYQNAPAADGMTVAVIALVETERVPRGEEMMQQILSSIRTCGEPLTAAPPPGVGEISFTLQGDTYRFAATGSQEPTSGVTVISGGSSQAVVSLTIVGGSAGTYDNCSFIFQWLDGSPPFVPNHPVTPVFMAVPGIVALQGIIVEYGPVGGSIRGTFSSDVLSGEFVVPHVPFPSGP